MEFIRTIAEFLGRYGIEISEASTLLMFGLYVALVNRKKLFGWLTGGRELGGDNLVAELRRLAVPMIMQVYEASEAKADLSGVRLKGAEKREMVRKLYGELGHLLDNRYEQEDVYERVTEQEWADIVQDVYSELDTAV